MPNLLEWSVGNRNPSISEIITSSGVIVDLTGKTVRFKARDSLTNALLVDQPVSNSPLDATGFVRYDWSAADITAPSGILSAARVPRVWWEVTSGGKTQDMMEALIRVVAHAPETNAYIEVEDLKATAELTGTGFADLDISVAILAASRGIDDALGRRFWQDTDAAQIRYYTPKTADTLWIDDLVTLTTLASDASGGTTFADVWTVNEDFVLEPLNAVAEGRPYTHITVHPTSSLYLPCAYPRSVRVTGRFGWPAVPSEVKTLTRLLAMRLLKRTREAPLGFVELGVDGAAVRASGYARDPEYAFLTEGISRKVVFA